MTPSDRRTFIKQSSCAVAGALALASSGKGEEDGPSDKIVMGAIGCGGQGTYLLTSFAGQPDVEMAFVCDPDQARANTAAAQVEQIAGRAPKVVHDLREVLDDPRVQAVTVA